MFNINDDDRCTIPIYFYENGNSENINPKILIDGWTEQGSNFEGTEALSDFAGGYIWVEVKLDDYEQKLTGQSDIPSSGIMTINLNF